MGMPTEEEMKEALALAARMREAGKDPHHLAKALLNLNYRVQKLEQVLEAVSLFLNTGMGVTEHQRLRRSVEEARKAIHRSSGTEEEKFGLG